MKKILTTYSITFLALIISCFLLSLIIGLFYNLELLDLKSYNLITGIASAGIFLLMGLFLGLKMKEKGLHYGGVAACVYLLVAGIITYGILSKDFEIMALINMLLRALLLPVGSVIGVNLRK